MVDLDASRQIRLLRAFAALTYPFACVPFLFFFFAGRGVSVPEYGTLIAIYYTTMVIVEVPTGLLADRFGERRALILGPLVLASAFWTIATSDTFAGFAAGQVLLGLGHSILSGPPSALMFASLRANDRSTEFQHQEAISQTLRLLGTGAAFLIGGIVASSIDIAASIFLTALLCACASIVAWFLRDVPRPAAPSRAALLRGATADLANPEVRWVLAYYVVLFCLLRFPFHTYQPFLLAAGADSPLWVGLLYAALNLFAAPFSRATPWATRSVGTRTIFWAMPVLIGVSLVLMAGQKNAFGIAMFFLHQVPFGMHWALVQDHANHKIRGAARATVLSVLSFAGRIAFAALFPLVMTLGLETAFLVVGIGGIAATVIVMLAGGRAAAR